MNGRIGVNKHQLALQVLKKTAFAGAAMLACAGVQAQTTVYSFGTQIGSPYATTFQPSDTFATLSMTTVDSMHYLFDLRATSNFNALFGAPAATIHRVAFNTSNVDPLPGSVRLASGSTWGVGHIYYTTQDAELGGVVFDFTEGWGNASTNPNSQLTSGERVVWESSFANPTSFNAPPFALKVFGLGNSGTGSAWYVPTVSAIPEPQTYGMLLAGLGLLGFVARRRERKAAAVA